MLLSEHTGHTTINVWAVRFNTPEVLPHGMQFAAEELIFFLGPPAEFGVWPKTSILRSGSLVSPPKGLDIFDSCKKSC
jgi:hypothetical protein